jgi:hypothetical protein
MTWSSVQALLPLSHFVDNDNRSNQQAQAGGYDGPHSLRTEKEK